MSAGPKWPEAWSWAEAHGIDAGVMRAAEGLARRAIGRGHGADGFLRITEILNPR
ncbi:imine reductase family protein [Sphaerisporangium perillae]|uniref:imine reductase family protein n=1 Tax=Sphaerisporangium perillae TaxID=2935860 RepID=UPI003557B325